MIQENDSLFGSFFNKMSNIMRYSGDPVPVPRMFLIHHKILFKFTFEKTNAYLTSLDSHAGG